MPMHPMAIIKQMAELDGPKVGYALVRFELPYSLKNYAPDEIKSDVVRHARLSTETVITTMNSSAARNILLGIMRNMPMTEQAEHRDVR